MAHFYGELQGSRGQTTRGGGKSSGIKSHIRGWKIGVETEMYFDEKTQEDNFRIYKTGGSNNHASLLIYDSGNENMITEMTKHVEDIKKLKKQLEKI